jgi:hypothetical protein
VKVKFVSGWLCLLRNYVIVMHGQQNIKFLENILELSAYSTSYFLYTEEVSLNKHTNKDCRNDVNQALVEESGLGGWTGKK